MLSLREAILREFGDTGADTLDRYQMQLEYTAFWCVRMLDPASRIDAVIPESIEDVVIERAAKYELRQVKTRAESVGDWSLDAALPILCAQYARRRAFNRPCSFHFVSNVGAANRPPRSARRPAPLWVLKHLLEKLAMDGVLNGDDYAEMRRLEGRLVPRIRDILNNNHGDAVSRADVIESIRNTVIETSSIDLIKPISVTELDAALHAYNSACPPYTSQQLQRISDAIVLLIIRKIRTGTTIDARRITPSEVFECSSPAAAPDNVPDLSAAAGRTLFEKKLALAGFDSTELPVFNRQKTMGEAFARELEQLVGMSVLDRVTIALLDLQRLRRRSISRVTPAQDVGPALYEVLKGEVVAEAIPYLPNGVQCDAFHCLGLLWSETSKCNAWWHPIGPPPESPL